MKTEHKLPKEIPSIEKVYQIAYAIPRKSKSGGIFSLYAELPMETLVNDYLIYDKNELAGIPEDIRGIRLYTVRNIPKNGISGRDFHRIQRKILISIDGTIQCFCEDLFGNKKDFVLIAGQGIMIPPFIAHTVVAIEENSGFMIMTNTIFDPNNPQTHDLHSMEEFNHLKTKLGKTKYR